MDAARDAQGGIQMILGAAEMLEQRGDESSTQRRFSEGDTGYYCMCRIQHCSHLRAANWDGC